MSISAPQTKSRRISVRLNAKNAAILQKLSQQFGCDVSEVVRLGLARLAASGARETRDTHTELCVTPASNLPVLLEKVPVLVSSPHGVGSVTTGVAKSVQGNVEGASVSPYSTKVAQLLPNYQAFGMRIWEERRSLFQRLCAAAVVASEANENHHDIQLCNELMRLGKSYLLL